MTTSTLRSTSSSVSPTSAPLGSWRYQTERKPRYALAFGAALALSLHAAVFYGTDTKSARPRVAAAAQEQVVQIEMPALPPEEQEEKVQELAEEQVATVAVPQLAEVPSNVALSDFSQLVELRPQISVDSSALRTAMIPVNHGRGGGGLGNGGHLFKLSDLDRVPQAIAQPDPNFPQYLRDQSEGGVVVVQFIVDADGDVRDARVVSSTERQLDRSALEGVRRWKFNPGMKNGRRVATLMEVPLRFRLTDAT